MSEDVKPPLRWVCWERGYGPRDEPGQGPRGKRIVVHFVYPTHSAAEAAEAAAAQLDQAEDDRNDCHCHRDGERRWIEVETPEGPQLFEVRCRVEPRYQAEEMTA